jgi:hypothetical protein
MLARWIYVRCRSSTGFRDTAREGADWWARALHWPRAHYISLRRAEVQVPPVDWPPSEMFTLRAVSRSPLSSFARSSSFATPVRLRPCPLPLTELSLVNYSKSCTLFLCSSCADCGEIFVLKVKLYWKVQWQSGGGATYRFSLASLLCPSRRRSRTSSIPALDELHCLRQAERLKRHMCAAPLTLQIR